MILPTVILLFNGTNKYIIIIIIIMIIIPSRWSRRRHVWLLIMRSRARSSALPQILNVD